MQISNSILRTAQYYETDSMRIVHHANYIKWMEESRSEFLKSVGFDWAYMERELQVMIPVRFQSVDYKYAIRFGDAVEVSCICDKFNGVMMNFSYEFKNPKDNLLLAKGVTKHGFINSNFEAVNLRDAYYEGYKILDQFLNEREDKIEKERTTEVHCRK